MVYATHGGGSFCSVGAGGGYVSTIGNEKTSNPLFTFDPGEDTFVTRLLSGYGSYPPYFLELREVNRKGVDTYGEKPPTLRSLSVPDLERSVAAGAVVVDIRDMRSFAAGHVPGSISIPWRTTFTTWLGWLMQRTSPVIFVADDTADRDDLVWAAFNVGIDNLIGALAGGMVAWKAAGRQVATIPITEVRVEGRHIVDVRQTSEFDAGHAAGAVLVELGSLGDSTEGVPDGPLLLHCGHGERAMTAASLLTRAGHEDVTVLAGSPGQLGPLTSVNMA
jgi:rhodanese-related sulfurtransferase